VEADSTILMKITSAPKGMDPDDMDLEAVAEMEEFYSSTVHRGGGEGGAGGGSGGSDRELGFCGTLFDSSAKQKKKPQAGAGGAGGGGGGGGGGSSSVIDLGDSGDDEEAVAQPPPAKRAKGAGGSGAAWECVSCTYQNPAGSKKCEMCDKEAGGS
jgi:hypothetical protein